MLIASVHNAAAAMAIFHAASAGGAPNCLGRSTILHQASIETLAWDLFLELHESGRLRQRSDRVQRAHWMKSKYTNSKEYPAYRLTV
jgi:hypothetical protein